MSNGPIKITQLPVATTTNPTQDLMIIVQNTAGTNTTYSITPSVLLAQTAFYTANNANYLGGAAAASYQLNSALGANIASYLPTYAGVVNASAYTVGSFFLANSTAVVTSIVNATTNVSTTTLYASNGAVYSSANVVINSSGISVANTNGAVLVGTIGTTQGFSANASLVTLGNSTVNTQINATHFFTGNSTNYGFGNSTYDALVTAAGGVNTSVYLINSSSANVGNSQFYGFGNSTVEGLYNTVANTSGVLTASNLSIGNSTSNVTINSTVVAIGSATSAANGASYLPNGLKLNWGWVSASSSAGAVTFTSPYTTNAWVVIATSNTAVATYGAAVTAWTKTGATILTANAAATNVFWQAIGT